MAQKTCLPEFIVTDNPWGVMCFGPIGPQKQNDGSVFNLIVNSTEMGCRFAYYKDGTKREVVERSSYEYCGVSIDPKQKEQIAKSIVAENGDIVLNASKGNLKIIAKNIYIESIGTDNAGVFMVNANGAIRLSTGDAMTLESGKGVCIRGGGSVNIVSDHFIKFVGRIKEGSPFSLCSLTSLESATAALIQQIQSSCK